MATICAQTRIHPFMDDHRVVWIKHIIYCNFNLQSDAIFQDFLKRDGEINHLLLERFLNGVGKMSCNSVQFYLKVVRETTFENSVIPFEPQGKDENASSPDMPNECNVENKNVIQPGDNLMSSTTCPQSIQRVGYIFIC